MKKTFNGQKFPLPLPPLHRNLPVYRTNPFLQPCPVKHSFGLCTCPVAISRHVDEREGCTAAANVCIIPPTIKATRCTPLRDLGRC